MRVENSRSASATPNPVCVVAYQSVLKGDVTKMYQACAQSRCILSAGPQSVCIVWKKGLSGGAVQTRRHARQTAAKGSVAMLI